MTDYYTENLGEFGFYEISTLKDILTAWVDNGLPAGFENSGVKPAMNKISGFVFLTNDDYQVAMLNDNILEVFHTLPDSGIEGFLNDIISDYSPDLLKHDDIEYIRQTAEISGTELEAVWLE